MRTKSIFILLALTFSACKAQENALLEKKLIIDFSDYPFYYDITKEKAGKTVWKERYNYMDSIAISDITYLSDGLKIKGFLVEPKKKGKYPVIIFNRGGSFEFGKLTLGMVSYWMGEIAKEGYVVIGSQYRGNGGSEGDEEFGGNDVNDVLNLIPVIEEIASADSEKIGMYGWSRGGMMTYLCLPKTNRIKAAAVGGAVSDFRMLESDRPGFLDYIPETEDDKEVAMNRRSAVLWADQFQNNVPILLLHGNADWRVKPEHSLKMALEFEKYRIPYRLIVFEGGNHGITEHRQEVDGQVLAWFKKYLKHDTPLPNMEYHGQ